MAQQVKPDAQLFQLLSDLLQQGVLVGGELGILFKVQSKIHRLAELVESLSNQKEVELRAKIEAIGLEVTKAKPSKELDELEIAAELDKLSAKLDHVDKMISSTVAEDPQARSLLSKTSDAWMPVITATADERRGFRGPSEE